MKITKRQFLFIIVALVWMGVIFWFSSNTGSDSSAQSGSIVDLISKYFFPQLAKWFSVSQEAFSDIATLLVRKSAHALEYLLLCLLIFGCLYGRRSLLRTASTAWILTVCYAASDEIHQYFVPDRACRAADVLIDGTGAAIGLIVLCLILRHRDKRTQSSSLQER